ncbi:unnamed protein product [Danaus chrysippus]|uniref:(African queen) hypothetical protein n=1 Tax=Danaus chrysippus TaxID=151541 RepID=A0A8J2VQR7_9NEOP|nr:unnamed protein product [Danaus chrysippus]
MKLGLIFFVFLFSMAASMAPRNRREQTSQEPQRYCAPQTPCAWAIYKKPYKNLIEMNVNNTYCVCEPGQTCMQAEENEAASAYVHKCIGTNS